MIRTEQQATLVESSAPPRPILEVVAGGGGPVAAALYLGVSDALRTHGVELPEETERFLASSGGALGVVCDVTGQTISDALELPPLSMRHRNLPEISRALAGDAYDERVHTTTLLLGHLGKYGLRLPELTVLNTDMSLADKLTASAALPPLGPVQIGNRFFMDAWGAGSTTFTHLLGHNPPVSPPDAERHVLIVSPLGFPSESPLGRGGQRVRRQVARETNRLRTHPAYRDAAFTTVFPDAISAQHVKHPWDLFDLEVAEKVYEATRARFETDGAADKGPLSRLIGALALRTPVSETAGTIVR